jgi:type II secretory pathway component PulF
MTTEHISISNADKLGLVGSFATMLTAGIPILEVVNSLREDSKGGQRKILDYMLEDLMQGKHIYLTFSRFPQVFDRVTVNVIKASEEAGTLEIALKDLKQTIQKDMEFSDKIRSALVYPVFIVFVFIAVLLMILVVVVPKISTVFSRLSVELPLPTRMLIFASNLLVNHTLEFLGGAGVIAVLVFVLYKSRKSALFDFFYSLPLVSTLVEQIDITRFSRSLHLLLSSGLPITGALELAEHVVVKRKTAQIISNSREMVLAGKSLSEGFRSAKGYIPTMMIKLMESGEKTGSLERSMQDISEYFDYQVTNTLKTLTALLEPIMLVLVGVCVGGMMLAIIAPIYGMIGQVGAR